MFSDFIGLPRVFMQDMYKETLKKNGNTVSTTDVGNTGLTKGQKKQSPRDRK